MVEIALFSIFSSLSHQEECKVRGVYENWEVYGIWHQVESELEELNPEGSMQHFRLQYPKEPVGLGFDGKWYIGREREARCCGQHGLV